MTLKSNKTSLVQLKSAAVMWSLKSARVYFVQKKKKWKRWFSQLHPPDWFNDPFQKSKIAYKNNCICFVFFHVSARHPSNAACLTCLYTMKPSVFSPSFSSSRWLWFRAVAAIQPLAALSRLIYERLAWDMEPHSNVPEHAYQNYVANFSDWIEQEGKPKTKDDEVVLDSFEVKDHIVFVFFIPVFGLDMLEQWMSTVSSLS